MWKKFRKETWISPVDRIRNTIDFILIRKLALHHFTTSEHYQHSNMPNDTILKNLNVRTHNTFQKQVTDKLEFSHRKTTKSSAKTLDVTVSTLRKLDYE